MQSNFWAVSKNWIGTKHFGTCKRTRHKSANFFYQFVFKNNIGKYLPWAWRSFFWFESIRYPGFYRTSWTRPGPTGTWTGSGTPSFLSMIDLTNRGQNNQNHTKFDSQTHFFLKNLLVLQNKSQFRDFFGQKNSLLWIGASLKACQ